MYHNHKYIIIILMIQILSLSNKNHAQTLSDSIISINSDNAKSDSFNLKPIKAPIIAFVILVAMLGGAIGGYIDPPEKGIPGEFSWNISKTGATFFVLGGICGSYVGYRLAKRQVEQKKKKLKDNAANKTLTLWQLKKIKLNQNKYDRPDIFRIFNLNFTTVY